MSAPDPEAHVEFEHKYDAGPDLAFPDLADLPGVAEVAEPERQELAATYVDTEDLRLLSRHVTLRRRKGGTDAGWHLKLPAGKDTRVELWAPLGRVDSRLARFGDLVSAYVRGARLRRVAVLETHRTVHRLLRSDGRVLAEVADDHVTARVALTTDRPGPAESRWREIEAELVSGPPELLDAVGERLREAGASRSATSSKLGRVLAPFLPPEGEPAGVPGTAGAEVTAYLAGQRDALLAYDPLARRAEPDAVHRMRVAVRRIRSILKSYRTVIDRAWTDRLRTELTWLAAELGEVRDLEVLRMRFTDRLAAAPGTGQAGPEWLDDLARRERDAYRGLNAALRSHRYFAILDALDDLVADPPLTDRAARNAPAEMLRLARRTWRRLERAYGSIGSAPDPDTARHEARKLAKQARYAAEAARPAAGKPAKVIAKQARRMQEVLGGYQDGMIAMAHLSTAAEVATDPSESFGIGVLYGIERTEAYAALAAVDATWREAVDEVRAG